MAWDRKTYLAYRKNYYRSHRDCFKAKAKAYYLEHKGEILRKRKERLLRAKKCPRCGRALVSTTETR